MNQGTLNHGIRAVGERGMLGVSSSQIGDTVFDCAQEKVAEAKDAIENRNSRLKNELLGGAFAIIDDIRDGLDFEKDGEIAFNLASLYDSMQRLLVEANVLGDTFLLDEVSVLLDEIKSGEHSFPGDAGKV